MSLCQQHQFETYFDTAAIRRKRIENTSARAGNSFLLITAMWWTPCTLRSEWPSESDMLSGEVSRLRTKEIKTPLNIVQGQERVRGKRHFISGPCPHEDMALPFYKIYGGMDCEAEADCISAENAAAADDLCGWLQGYGSICRKGKPCRSSWDQGYSSLKRL